jgi:small subunit ribosomal protein S2
MNRKYSGIKDLDGKPGLVFVTDMLEDANAVREAKKLGVPVIAIADTNTNPTTVDYPIPANDDAVKGLQLIIDYVVAAIDEGKATADKKEGK